MARLTTKVREGDWRSIEKAIDGLEASLGQEVAPQFNGATITNIVNVSGNQITNFALHKVADTSARLALTPVEAQVVFQQDVQYPFIAVTL